jgi:fructosamine-3-kinase
VSPETAAAFAAEANGLRWLGEPGAVPIPEVLAAEPAALVISMITPGQATPEAAFRFGAELARLHAAGADTFGAPWRGFIASLPLDNTPGPAVPVARLVREPKTASLPAPGHGLRRAGTGKTAGSWKR